jgi:AcrR family transcriptional regulator
MHGQRKRTRTHILTAYRRDALLRAAMRVFGDRGFDCATMEEIAHEADVAKGTTYLYYRSKQSIYDQSLSRGLTELDAQTREAIDRAPDLHAAIPAFVTARARYFLDHRDFFRMYVSAIARQVTSARVSEFQAMIDRQTHRLEEAVTRAVARREIRKVDPAATTMAIFDLTRGLVARGVMADRRFDIDREAAFVSALVWEGLAREKGKRLRPPPPKAPARPRRS